MKGKVCVGLFLVGMALGGAVPAWAQCALTVQQVNADEEVVTVQCDDFFTSGSITTGCCRRPCSIDMAMQHVCEREPLEAWVEIDGQRLSPNMSIQGANVQCGPCCDGGGTNDCSWVRGTWRIQGTVQKRMPCDGEEHRAVLKVRVRVGLGGEAVLAEWTQPWRSCERGGICISDRSDPHRGDGCCDPAQNRDPARGNNLNDACIALFGVSDRACCRPANRLPPGGDPTHPRTGHPPLSAWLQPGWCDACGGGGGGGGCRSNADCGPGQVCCNGTCVTGSSCTPPPPSGFDAIIEVIGSQRHRWNPELWSAPPVPMSFRIWDLSGQYLWETDRACYNEDGHRMGDVACWSRPWLVPDYAENPTGVVRTHRIRLTSPKSVYVQPECGVEFNAVLNPAKLASMYPEGSGPIVFHPQRGIRVDLAETTCPRRENVCADGRPCGKCPDGQWPLPDGTCLGGALPSGNACKDGSECKSACVYTIDLRNVYERRQTPAWCYEDPAKDRACQGGNCQSTEADAVDDWRVSSPWCWEQVTPKGWPGGRQVGQPASFVNPPNCTIDVPGKCWDPQYFNPDRCPVYRP